MAVGCTKICKAEFLRKIQVIEERMGMLEPPTMIKGRQIFWMIINKFKRSDIEGALQELSDLFRVTLVNDDLPAFENDWDWCIGCIDEMPSDKMKEHLIFKQLDTSKQLTTPMQIYKNEVLHEDAPRSYLKLKKILKVHNEERAKTKTNRKIDQEKDRKVLAQREQERPTPPTKDSEKGTCTQWRQKGSCSRGDDCLWKATHTAENRNRKVPPKA